MPSRRARHPWQPAHVGSCRGGRLPRRWEGCCKRRRRRRRRRRAVASGGLLQAAGGSSTGLPSLPMTDIVSESVTQPCCRSQSASSPAQSGGSPVNHFNHLGGGRPPAAPHRQRNPCGQRRRHGGSTRAAQHRQRNIHGQRNGMGQRHGATAWGRVVHCQSASPIGSATGSFAAVMKNACGGWPQSVVAQSAVAQPVHGPRAKGPRASRW